MEHTIHTYNISVTDMYKMSMPYYISLFWDHCATYLNADVPAVKRFHLERCAEWLSPEYTEEITIIVSIDKSTIQILGITHRIGTEDQLIKFRMSGDSVHGIRFAALRYDTFSPYKLYMYRQSDKCVSTYLHFDVTGEDQLYHSSQHVLPPRIEQLHKRFKDNKPIFNECIAKLILESMGIVYPID